MYKTNLKSIPKKTKFQLQALDLDYLLSIRRMDLIKSTVVCFVTYLEQ